MASAAAKSAVEKILSKKRLSIEDAIEIRTVAYANSEESKALAEICHAYSESGGDANAVAAAFWARGQTEEALDAAEEVSNKLLKAWIMGASYLELGRYAEAAEWLAKAAEKCDHPKVLVAYADALEAIGEAEELRKFAKTRINGQVALAHYVEGLLKTLEGDYEKAMEEFGEAARVDENLHEAHFRQGYLASIYGDEEEAIQHYEKCLEAAPGFINAYLNLGILYEDLGILEKAEDCFRSVLEVCPTHPRARLYYKDVRASQREVIEEERDRDFVREENVLDTPWSEFELSVRSRSCLEKMGIRTLGDLTRVSEKQLLSYKNFGETSLKEIKEMLARKGLRLGQALEEDLGGAGRRATRAEMLLQDLMEPAEGQVSIQEALTRPRRHPSEPFELNEEEGPEGETEPAEESAEEEPDLDDLAPDEEDLLEAEEEDYDELEEFEEEE